MFLFLLFGPGKWQYRLLCHTFISCLTTDVGGYQGSWGSKGWYWELFGASFLPIPSHSNPIIIPSHPIGCWCCRGGRCVMRVMLGEMRQSSESTCQGHLPWRTPSAFQIDPSQSRGSNRETAADVISVHGFADAITVFVVFCGGCFLVSKD